jgi:hypothetical protein
MEVVGWQWMGGVTETGGVGAADREQHSRKSRGRAANVRVRLAFTKTGNRISKEAACKYMLAGPFK